MKASTITLLAAVFNVDELIPAGHLAGASILHKGTHFSWFCFWQDSSQGTTEASFSTLPCRALRAWFDPTLLLPLLIQIHSTDVVAFLDLLYSSDFSLLLKIPKKQGPWTPGTQHSGLVWTHQKLAHTTQVILTACVGAVFCLSSGCVAMNSQVTLK